MCDLIMSYVVHILYRLSLLLMLSFPLVSVLIVARDSILQFDSQTIQSLQRVRTVFEAIYSQASERYKFLRGLPVGYESQQISNAALSVARSVCYT